jgi:hypothetical protein
LTFLIGLVGLVIAVIGALIGVSLIRDWIKDIVGRDINKSFDRVRIALVIVGFVIALVSLIQNQYEKEIAQKSLREAQQALRKAHDEIAAVRDVALRDEYRALSPELRRRLVSDLRAVQDRFKDMPLQIFVMSSGSQIRQKITADLAAILSEAMFNAIIPKDSSYSSLGGVLPDVQITSAPAHRQLIEAFMPVFGQFINTQFSVSLAEGNFGRLWVFINGDPLFMPDGTITFR